jgi:hypothetical protein
MLCSSVKANLHFGETHGLHIQGPRVSQTNQHDADRALFSVSFMLVSCFTYTSTMKMEAICSSKTYVDFHWTIQPYILEDRTLQIYRLTTVHEHFSNKIVNSGTLYKFTDM